MEQLALQEMYPEIRSIGAQLAAITPNKAPLAAEHPLSQVGSQMGIGPTGEGRPFPVLWDEGNRVADLFGLKHDFSDATKNLFLAFEMDMEKINGEAAGWTLPLPSTFIIDQVGIIRHAVVTADWRTRPEADDLLDRLKQVVAES